MKDPKDKDYDNNEDKENKAVDDIAENAQQLNKDVMHMNDIVSDLLSALYDDNLHQIEKNEDRIEYNEREIKNDDIDEGPDTLENDQDYELNNKGQRACQLLNYIVQQHPQVDFDHIDDYVFAPKEDIEDLEIKAHHRLRGHDNDKKGPHLS